MAEEARLIVERLRADSRGVTAAWQVQAAALPDSWTEAMLVAELNQEAGRYWSGRLGSGEAVAIGGYWRIVDEAHLVLLAVHPRAQGRGLGTALLAHLLGEARRETRHMTLEVRESNRPALALYSKFGFTALGRRPRYYGEEDALILWTPRIDTPTYAVHLAELRSASGWCLVGNESGSPGEEWVP
jgi:ribosomal-protein-alanine N-acetyltransferase